VIAYQAICEVHGPMRHYESERIWKCLGWDGEGHAVNHIPDLTDEAVSRIGRGMTRWPGVRVEESVQ
jgi:hypothetical protein